MGLKDFLQFSRTARDENDNKTVKKPEHPDRQLPVIIERSMPAKRRTYGKKTTTTAPSASAIFGNSSLNDSYPPRTGVTFPFTQSPQDVTGVDKPKPVVEKPVDTKEVEVVKGGGAWLVLGNTSKVDFPVAASAKQNELLKKVVTKEQISSPKPIGPSHGAINTTFGPDHNSKLIVDDKASNYNVSILTADEIAKSLSTLKLAEPTIEEDSEFDASYLDPLVVLYSDNTFPLEHVSWEAILPKECKLSKIAEASYAEIYRVTTPNATSIVKIMPLTVPYDPASLTRSFSSNIDDVISELQIMNVLTEMPGFVTFKGAKIVTGKQSEMFVRAWEKWTCGDHEKSQFDHPASYGKNATFLAIELGDAGDVLEDAIIDTVDKFWDVFLGTVVALARAENLNEFEHRDLHESNICVFAHPIPDWQTQCQTHSITSPKYGRSGLEITIIDYGLSRAELKNGQIAFKNLEDDLEIFQGEKGHKQYETYRQMRSFLFSGETKKFPMSFHTTRNPIIDAGKSWEEHVSYTNVLWLSYLLEYLHKEFTNHQLNPPPAKIQNPPRGSKVNGSVPASSCFNSITSARNDLETSKPARITQPCRELNLEIGAVRTLFNSRTLAKNGAFRSARDVVEHCLKVGWILHSQLSDEPYRGK